MYSASSVICICKWVNLQHIQSSQNFVIFHRICFPVLRCSFLLWKFMEHGLRLRFSPSYTFFFVLEHIRLAESCHRYSISRTDKDCRWQFPGRFCFGVSCFLFCLGRDHQWKEGNKDMKAKKKRTIGNFRCRNYCRHLSPLNRTRHSPVTIAMTSCPSFIFLIIIFWLHVGSPSIPTVF